MTKTEDTRKVRKSGGRPSQEDAGLIDARILDAATALFFAQGYGITSIEAIVASARVSKRTLYARYNDKAEVFRAVIQQVIGHLRPSNTAQLFQGKDVREILLRVAGALAKASLSSEGIAMHRLLQSEAQRFPEIANIASGQGARAEALRYIFELLQRETEAGHLAVADTHFAAEQFMQMVVAAPQRRAMGLGKPMTAREVEEWVEKTVELFLNGCRKT